MKAQHKTIGLAVVATLVVIAAIHKVAALEPVKDAVFDDGSWF